MKLIVQIDREVEAKKIADKALENFLVEDCSDKLTREEKNALHNAIYDAARISFGKEPITFVGV